MDKDREVAKLAATANGCLSCIMVPFLFLGAIVLFAIAVSLTK